MTFCYLKLRNSSEKHRTKIYNVLFFFKNGLAFLVYELHFPTIVCNHCHLLFLLHEFPESLQSGLHDFHLWVGPTLEKNILGDFQKSVFFDKTISFFGRANFCTYIHMYIRSWGAELAQRKRGQKINENQKIPRSLARPGNI
jgi:hypothetical protein